MHLDLAFHYGDLFEVPYGSDKTKIVVYGANIDEEYYASVKPWKINGERIPVLQNNEHL